MTFPVFCTSASTDLRVGLKNLVPEYLSPTSRVATLCLPLFKSMGQTAVSSSVSVGSIYYVVGDVSLAGRFIGNVSSAAVGTDACLGATVSVFVPVGIFSIYDSVQQVRMSRKLKDPIGFGIAIGGLIENIGLTLGAIVNLGFRICQALKDFSAFVNMSLMMPVLASAVTAFSFLSSVFFCVFFGGIAGRSIASLYYLYAGRELRSTLSQEKDPIAALEVVLEREMNKELGTMSKEDYEKILLEEVSLLFCQLEKKSGKKKLHVAWKGISSSEKEALMRRFLETYPEYIEMKDLGFSVNTFSRAGRCLAQKRVEAKLFAKYERLLGSEVMKGMRAGDVARVRIALESVKKEVALYIFKIALCCVGIAAMIFGCITLFVVTGGLAPLVVGFCSTLSGILWIVVNDAKAFSDWNPREKFGIGNKSALITGIVLNVLAFCGIFSLLILSGGSIVYIIPVAVALFWLAVNLHAVFCWYRLEKRPWDYLETISPKVFHAFTRSFDDKSLLEKETLRILNRMSQYDRKNILALQSEWGWKEAAALWEMQKKQEKRDAFELLINRLNDTFDSLKQESNLETS
jgi:hypothetical protein